MANELSIVINEHNKVNLTYGNSNGYNEETKSFISNPGELAKDLKNVILDGNKYRIVTIYVCNSHLYLYDIFKLGCLLKDDSNIMIISL